MCVRVNWKHYDLSTLCLVLNFEMSNMIGELKLAGHRLIGEEQVQAVIHSLLDN